MYLLAISITMSGTWGGFDSGCQRIMIMRLMPTPGCHVSLHANLTDGLGVALFQMR